MSCLCLCLTSSDHRTRMPLVNTHYRVASLPWNGVTRHGFDGFIRTLHHIYSKDESYHRIQKRVFRTISRIYGVSSDFFRVNWKRIAEKPWLCRWIKKHGIGLHRCLWRPEILPICLNSYENCRENRQNRRNKHKTCRFVCFLLISCCLLIPWSASIFAPPTLQSPSKPAHPPTLLNPPQISPTLNPQKDSISLTSSRNLSETQLLPSSKFSLASIYSRDTIVKTSN